MNEIHLACACLGTCKKWPFTCSGLPEWINIKVRFPENKQLVLAIDYHHEMAVCEFQKTDQEYFFMLFNTSHQIIKVTHWMYLPEIPNEKRS